MREGLLPDTKLIPLTQGKFAIVDAEDYEFLIQFKWCYNTGYAVRATWDKINKKTGIIYLHRFLITTKKGEIVDHINGDRLDNRKCNLRLCTHVQNIYNCGMSKNNTSGFKGVYWHKRSKAWRAKICHNRKTIVLGEFKTAKEAAVAYDEAALKCHGEFAVTNKMLGTI